MVEAADGIFGGEDVLETWFDGEGGFEGEVGLEGVHYCGHVDCHEALEILRGVGWGGGNGVVVWG